jgi:hypothetical protein
LAVLSCLSIRMKKVANRVASRLLEEGRHTTYAYTQRNRTEHNRSPQRPRRPVTYKPRYKLLAAKQCVMWAMCQAAACASQGGQWEWQHQPPRSIVIHCQPYTVRTTVLGHACALLFARVSRLWCGVPPSAICLPGKKLCSRLQFNITNTLICSLHKRFSLLFTIMSS